MTTGLHHISAISEGSMQAHPYSTLNYMKVFSLVVLRQHWCALIARVILILVVSKKRSTMSSTVQILIAI